MPGRRKTACTAQDHQDIALSQFLDHLQSQIEVLRQEFDPSLHGHVEILSSFGRIYLVEPPASFVEDTDGISLSQINLALLSSRRHNLPPQLKAAKPNLKRQSWKGKTRLERVSLMRSAFIPGRRDATVQEVEEILFGLGFGDPIANEAYRAIISCPSQQVKAVYNTNLEFQYVVLDNTRWMMTDVKRNWVEDESNIEGKESDVRFQLQTRKVSDAERDDGSEYEGLLFWTKGTRECEDSHPSVKNYPNYEVRVVYLPIQCQSPDLISYLYLNTA